MKKSISILLAFSLMASFFVTNTSANEIVENENIQIGDYVQLGTYLDEPILWRYVISDENGKMLISDKQISMKCYSGGTNQKKAWDGEVSYNEVSWGNNQWSISDIRSWLNSMALSGEVEWLDGTAPNEDASFRGYNPYDNESGFLSASNFSEDDLKLIKTVQLKTYDKENIITNIEDIGSLSVADIEIDLNGVEYTTTEDRIFIPDLVEIKKICDNSNTLGEHYYYAVASEKAKEQTEISYGSDEWDIWLRCPDYSTLNTEYDEGVHTSTLGKKNVFQNGEVQSIYGIGWRASCGSDLTGIRPAFYLEDEFDIQSGNGTSDSPYILSAPGVSYKIDVVYDDTLCDVELRDNYGNTTVSNGGYISEDKDAGKAYLSIRIKNIESGYRIKSVYGYYVLGDMNVTTNYTDGVISGTYGGMATTIYSDTTFEIVLEKIPDNLPVIAGVVGVFWDRNMKNEVDDSIEFNETQNRIYTDVVYEDGNEYPEYCMGCYWEYSTDGEEWIALTEWGNRNDFWAAWSYHSKYFDFINSNNYYMRAHLFGRNMYSTGDVYSDVIKVNFSEEQSEGTVSTVSKSGNTYTVDVSLYGMPDTCNILIAGYKGEAFVTYLKYAYNEDMSINTKLAGDIDKIKVMVWKDITGISPVFPAEVIHESEFITE